MTRWSRFLASSSFSRWSASSFLSKNRVAVNAGEHFFIFVAAPVGPSHAHEFIRLAQLAGIGQVRASTHVDEIALSV